MSSSSHLSGSTNLSPMSSGVLTGPWWSAFFLDLPPVPSKSNFRRQIHSDRWSSMASFEDSTKMLVRSALPETWLSSDPDAKIAERPQVVALVAAFTLIDADNLLKAVLDAAAGPAYTNDASVRFAAGMSVRRKGSEARGFFAQLPATATPADVSAAASALTLLAGTWLSENTAAS